MIFRLHALRFCFVARDAVVVPPGLAENVLRGALGTILRRMACVPDCPGTAQCERRQSCLYARVFEPGAAEGGPSGLAQRPRPFVIRARELAGRRHEPGERLHFDLHLFDLTIPLSLFAQVFAELAREGLGLGRGRLTLEKVCSLNADGGCPEEVETVGAPLEFDLRETVPALEWLRVRFLTPTELKSQGQVVTQPEFGILMARVRDRISTLREAYGEGALAMDYAAFGERAGAIRMTRCELRGVKMQRRSTRTGQVHPLGGFTGEAEFEGALEEFLPYLRIACWTGVGRQTVWGKGAIAVEDNPNADDNKSLMLF